MLFNSYEFIFGFLPLVLWGYFGLAKYAGCEPAIVWLILASLCFYGYWNPAYLLLILASIGFNFSVGKILLRWHQRSQYQAAKSLLIIGVTVNLSSIGYFKYANFFVETMNQTLGLGFYLDTIILPLGISFFTFQQITFLVDAWKGKADDYSFSHYALFVSFFPQLIAGPIVHHGEIIPQFMRKHAMRPSAKHMAIGISFFFMGLFKKVVLADPVATYATPVFQMAAEGDPVTFFLAWGGALAYTLQLYFDFSGYSDMAMGLAFLFGIRLPFNFNSPYKATSIIEFWRRWHITLSVFLKDYVYIPLGGNRKGTSRRYLNLLMTMLLGGLWHGAGWTFIIWGGLHGCYLIINHTWHRLSKPIILPTILAWMITFVAVVVSWVVFKSVDIQAALIILKGMTGGYGITLPNGIAVHLGSLSPWLQAQGIVLDSFAGSEFIMTYVWVLSLLAIAITMPNTQELMAPHHQAAIDNHDNKQNRVLNYPRLNHHLVSSYNARWAFIIGAISTLALLSISQVSEFLYFQF